MRSSRLLRLVQLFFTLGVLATGGLMMALFAAGIFAIARGSGVLLHLTQPPADQQVTAYGLHAALEGLELMFLAPLPLLVFGSLKECIVRFAKGEPLHEMHASLSTVKGMVVGLLIATVSTDLVARALHRDGLDYESALTRCAVLAVFCVYLLSLDRQQRHAADPAAGRDG